MKRSLLSSGIKLSLLTFVSRILGLVREMTKAAFLGTSALADAFGVAFMIPNLFRRLFAENSISVAFIPTFKSYLEDSRRGKTEADVQAFLNAVFTVVSFTTALTVIAGVMAAHFAHPDSYPLIVPVVLAVVIGTAVGMINGLGVAYGNIPPFIITLATMTAVRGTALIASGGSPVYGLSDSFKNISSGTIGNTIIPVLAVYFICVLCLSGFILTKTVFGRRIYAIGGNESAAAVSGINVKRMRLIIYSISGALAGFAGLLLASRTYQGSPTAGQSYELDAIAAVIIGGISMSGGSGKWYGTLIGALLLAVLANGLDILNVSSNYQMIIKGCIITLAVLVDINSKKKQA